MTDEPELRIEDIEALLDKAELRIEDIEALLDKAESWERSYWLCRDELKAAEAERDRWKQREQDAKAREEQLRAERDAAKTRIIELEITLQQIEPVLDELCAWVDTNLIGCLEVQERGEASLRLVRDTLEKEGIVRDSNVIDRYSVEWYKNE